MPTPFANPLRENMPTGFGTPFLAFRIKRRTVMRPNQSVCASRAVAIKKVSVMKEL